MCTPIIFWGREGEGVQNPPIPSTPFYVNINGISRANLTLLGVRLARENLDKSIKSTCKNIILQQCDVSDA